MARLRLWAAAGGVVEIDETFIGHKEGTEIRRGGSHKNDRATLVERGGSARSFHVDSTRKDELLPIVRENIAREAAS